MEIVWAALLGFGLDMLLGDPAWMPHPVVWMGRCITGLEAFLRRYVKNELLAGGLLAGVLPVGALALSAGGLWLCGRIHPALAFALATLWCWQALAARGLRDESMKVYRQLTRGTLEGARAAVSRIVGRDTGQLTAQGVARAAVETVAENFSDGVAAPLFYMLIGGAPLALCYKAVNTMDSMVGYKNERYLIFGCPAAKLDDAANYIPARLAAFLLMGAAWLRGRDVRGAFRIWRRDRRRHASPNSAQTEAAMAGALGLRLAGPARYLGQRYEKPYIGDPVRPIRPEDIPAANGLMLTASLLCLALLAGGRALIILVLL